MAIKLVKPNPSLPISKFGKKILDHPKYYLLFFSTQVWAFKQVQKDWQTSKFIRINFQKTSNFNTHTNFSQVLKKSFISYLTSFKIWLILQFLSKFHHESNSTEFRHRIWISQYFLKLYKSGRTNLKHPKAQVTHESLMGALCNICLATKETNLWIYIGAILSLKSFWSSS